METTIIYFDFNMTAKPITEELIQRCKEYPLWPQGIEPKLTQRELLDMLSQCSRIKVDAAYLCNFEADTRTLFAELQRINPNCKGSITITALDRAPSTTISVGSSMSKYSSLPMDFQEVQLKQKNLTMKIKLLRDGKMPEKHEKGDWFDVFSAVDREYSKGDTIYIPLGFACQLPKGYEAHLCVRSSTFAKTGLLQTNGIGIIDNSFCGDNDEWLLPVTAFSNGSIHKHQKIAQFRLMEVQPTVTLVQVKQLNNEDRNGFGSTGD